MIIYLQMIETQEDRDKFTEMYNQYHSLMYKAAHDILQSDADAEDVVHQAFLRVIDNMDRVKDTVSQRTKNYLITIVENISIDIYRDRKNHPQVEYNDETVGIHVEYTGDDSLTRCLIMLPPRYREIITLKYHHNYDNRRIAKLLGTTEVNVRKLEQRARDKLRALLEKEGVTV